MLFAGASPRDGVSASDLSELPFLPLLAECALSLSWPPSERALVCELLSSPRPLSSALPASRLSRPAPPPSPELAARLSAALSAARARLEGVAGLAGAWRRAGLSRAASEGEREAGAGRQVLGPEEEGQAAGEEGTLLVQARHLGGGFEPRWIRPAPPRCEGEAGEVVWMDVDAPGLDVLWDTGMGAEEAPLEELRHLLAMACREPLVPALQKQLLERLEEGHKWLAQSGLSPKKLPELVENNPSVAIEMLLKLLSSQQPPPDVTEYLSVLVNMEMTLQSMEVVNRLTTAVDLPTEFVHLYISNCITSCRNIPEKFNQNRLVRLVCVFLQSLIRNKIVDVEDLRAEVQGFCLEFIKVKEAASLFRMLRTLEADPDAQIPAEL